ncbi:hypothetical protein [Bradyrhizobium sp. UFLA05-112]
MANIEGKALTADDLVKFLATRFLSSTAVGTRNLQLTISGVEQQLLRDRNGRMEWKPVLVFSNGQQLPLNKSNLRTINEKLGDDPAAWIGAVTSVFTDDSITFEGKPALRVKVLKAAKPGPTGPGSDIPFE